MAGHTSEKRWRDNQNPVFGNVGVSNQASSIVSNVIAALTQAEAAFAEMQEMYAFAGGTVQLLADQLFFEDWSVRLVDPQVPAVFETEANAEELAKTQDLFDAITAVHELHQCADNQIVAQEDRYAQLRRMS